MPSPSCVRPSRSIPSSCWRMPTWACALSLQGRNAAAAAEFRAYLRAQPGQPRVLGWLAWVLATAPEDAVRSGPEAVALAERAAESTSHSDAEVLHALAAAYAETGRYEQAVQVAGQALAIASAAGSQPLVAEIQQSLACYREKRPFRPSHIAFR